MNTDEATKMEKRTEEKGAAMVMALLLSFLLITACAGVLLEAAMNTANVTDATAEQQAYNAAESGIQSAVDVLRHNTSATYVEALKTDTTGTARMSEWITYGADSGTRVQVGSGTYTEQDGFAYSLNISDPDNTGSAVTFTTKAVLNDCDLLDTTNPDLGCADEPYPHKTYDDGGGNKLRITYIPNIVANQDLLTDNNVNLGTFKVEVTGNGALITAFNRFEIRVKMTAPYEANRTVRGFIETNTSAGTPPKIIFDATSFTLQGSIINLDFNSGSFVYFPDDIPQRVGYEADMTALASGTSDTVITSTMSPPEPLRLLIASTGYGPRGAKKMLEAIIQKNFFNGLGAPATLTLVGPKTSPDGTDFVFNPGDSEVTTYSGDDTASTDIIPPIGTTDPDILEDVQSAVDGHPPHPFNGTVVGTPSDVSNDMPEWLSSPTELDEAVHTMYDTAVGSTDASNTVTGNRFFPSGTTPDSFGDPTTGTNITFCDGDLTFGGSQNDPSAMGGGILVVTGKLTLQGNFYFKGLIIVTGEEGVVRSGGGTGTIEGNIVVSPYANNKIYDDPSGTPYDLYPDASDGFLAPQYDLSGGGNSTIRYNSSSLANGLQAISNFVLGVAEK